MIWLFLALTAAVGIILADSIRKDQPHAYAPPPCGVRCCDHCAVCGLTAEHVLHRDVSCA